LPASTAACSKARDKKLALTHLRAYNDWHIDEWCGAYPERFIPLGLLPLWDMDETVKEVRRLADKGCFAVTMSENPTIGGMPGIHTGYYERLFKASPIAIRRSACTSAPATSRRTARPNRRSRPTSRRCRWRWRSARPTG
jgi:hypothetical protein